MERPSVGVGVRPSVQGQSQGQGLRPSVQGQDAQISESSPPPPPGPGPGEEVASTSSPSSKASPAPVAQSRPTLKPRRRGGTACRKIRLLIWKNLLFRRRHLLTTSLEVLIPIFFTVLLCLLYRSPNPEQVRNPKFLIDIKEDKPEDEDIKSWFGEWQTVPHPSGGGPATKIFYTPDNDPSIQTLVKDFIKSSSPSSDWEAKGSLAKVKKEVESYPIKKLLLGNPQALVMFDKNLATIKSDKKGTFNYGIKFLSPRKEAHLKAPIIQRVVDNAVISMITGESTPKWTYKFSSLSLVLNGSNDSHAMFGAKDSDTDRFAPFGYFVVFFVGMGFSMIVTPIMQGIVSEKETGIKELMKLSRLPNWMHWTAWTLNFVALFTITVTLVTVIMFQVGIDGEHLLWLADKSLVWMVIWLFVFATMTFTFFLASFFSKPIIAQIVAAIIFIITAIGPATLLRSYYANVSLSGKLAISLMPNAGLFFAFRIIAKWEFDGGAKWTTLFEGDEDDPLTLGHVIIMLVVDIFLYFLLALYLEAVLPSEFGIRRDSFFFVKPSFWGCGKQGSGSKVKGQDKDLAVDDPGEGVRPGSKVKGQDLAVDDPGDGARPGFEPEPAGRPFGVEIQNLRKMFGKNAAVDGVSLKMFDGEIFALLGHNGAGKTTTISCCIGMTAPTSGTIIINGFDSVQEMDSVREQIGICPQHNLLFDYLTVDEHLIFFGKLKGMSSADAKTERVEMLEKLELTSKAKTLSKHLSGGQKRKLCLAISLIGNAKVVFLDEPTSGMDVEARRAIWDLLLAERGHRTIVLTTHFMEEADVLGDRIGIMAHGKVQCCGTSTFLKKFYGTGYSLSMTMADNSTEKQDAVLFAVQALIPTAGIKDDPHAPKDQFDLNLPTESVSNATIAKLFKTLQEKKASFGIKTFTLSLTTMDEVFVKVDEAYSNSLKGGKLELVPIPSKATNLQDQETGSEGIDKKTDPPEGSNPTDPDSNLESTDTPLSPEAKAQKDEEKMEAESKVQEHNRVKGISLIFLQFASLIIKRYHFSNRKWSLAFPQIIVPLFLVIFGIVIANTILPSNAKKDDQSPVKFGIATHPKDIVTLYRDNSGAGAKDWSAIIGPSAQPLSGSEPFRLALGKKSQESPKEFFKKNLVAFDLTPTEIHVYYRPTSKAMAQNMASNILLRLTSATSTEAAVKNADVHLQMTQLPPVVELNEEKLTKILGKMTRYFVSAVSTHGVFVPMAVVVIAASFIVAPLEERICSAKQLQLMTGVSPVIYWMAFFLWDFILMVIVSGGMVLAFLLVQEKTDDWVGVYTIDGGAGTLFLILIVFAYAVIPFSHLLSLLLSTVSCGFATVLCTLYFVYLIAHISSMMMEGSETQWMYILAVVFRVLGSPFPSYGFTMALEKYLMIALRKSRCMFLPQNKEVLLCQDDDLGWATPRYPPDHLSRGKMVDVYQCCKNCRRSPDCVGQLQYITWWTEMPELGLDKVREVAGVGQELIYLFLLGTIFHVILLLWEVFIGGMIREMKMGQTLRTSHVQNVDEDVEEEARRVIQLIKEKRLDEDVLVVENFSRNFGTFAAVKDINFGVHHGECFGLLGVNGAGKTTTFRMLTGDEGRTSGNAFASGSDLKTSRKKFLRKIGYCPQFDGIVGVLTGLEMVQLFARLRGVKDAKNEAQYWMTKVGLTDSENVQCRKYSGGMKRRLSAAMALIGDPEILLLDEPTTGVDPVSRREFWKIILSTKAAGRAIILTSHSMDEITACCTRLAIMVNGQLQCLGGVQYLRNKFAQGFSLDLKLTSATPADEEWANLDREIKEKLAPCSLKDSHATALQYHIEDATIPWDILFTKMEEIRAKYPALIRDYYFSETTLEQVFLSFARKQYPPRTAPGGCLSECKKCFKTRRDTS